ncbi:putative pyroglutamyl peptidase type I [Thozetella sp. PMI_491]|nr:putative pyroglutamyl peptidase type I [Thozetella sp. PMI_491]
MGSTADDTARRELTVLVTGFGPFKKEFPLNPSWAIAEQLPEYLPSVRAKGPHASSAPRLPPVRILVHPEPIRVNYMTVRELVPTLWDLEGKRGQPKIDIAVHIGMAGPELEWQLERRGHRDGYALKDVDGEFLRDQNRKLKEGKNWVWDGVPAELLTDVNVEDVFARWKKYSPDDLDIKISEDAGRFLCDFIYFSSLAHLYKAEQKRNVVFLHVPANVEPENIARGKDLVLQLIRSLAESEVRRQ